MPNSVPVIDRAMSLPYSRCPENGGRNVGLGPFNGRWQLQALCNTCRYGRGGCTSGAMGMKGLDPFGFEQMESVLFSSRGLHRRSNRDGMTA